MNLLEWMRRNEFMCVSVCVYTLICSNEISFPFRAWWIWNIVYTIENVLFIFVSHTYINQYSFLLLSSLLCLRSRENLFMFVLFISFNKKDVDIEEKKKKKSVPISLCEFYENIVTMQTRMDTHARTHTRTHFVYVKQTIPNACLFLYDWIQVFI